MPITSPLSASARWASVSSSTGARPTTTASNSATRQWDQGAGGAVWLTITAFRMSVGVAHGKGSGTRVNFGGGLTF